jgi:H+-transporting ATPase
VSRQSLPLGARQLTVLSLLPFLRLETDMSRGLGEADVTKRRAAFGYNELESPSENLFLKFLGFFKGPILYGE